MYDVEGRAALSEARLRLVLADMGLDAENDETERLAIDRLVHSLRAAGGQNIDPSDGSLRIPAFEFLRVMQAQEFMQGEAGRYWVALSLAEAEALRGAMHASNDADAPLIGGKRVAVGLRVRLPRPSALAPGRLATFLIPPTGRARGRRALRRRLPG